MKCTDCPYWWADDESSAPDCHYLFPDDDAPCVVADKPNSEF